MAVAVTLPYGKQLGFGESGRRKVIIADVAFTSATYSSGVSLSGSVLGLPNAIESLEFVQGGSADAKMYKWDPTNSKIRIYAESAGSFAEVSGAQTFTVRVNAVGW